MSELNPYEAMELKPVPHERFVASSWTPKMRDAAKAILADFEKHAGVEGDDDPVVQAEVSTYHLLIGLAAHIGLDALKEQLGVVEDDYRFGYEI